jgi:uncharacterized membrane protein
MEVFHLYNKKDNQSITQSLAALVTPIIHVLINMLCRVNLLEHDRLFVFLSRIVVLLRGLSLFET